MVAEAIDLLEQLGLTEYEAKTLATLFKLKETEAPEISRLAQVPKTRVYDVLERLTKKGLVIEIYGRPKRYRVIEPASVFEELVKQKRMEVKKLEEKTAELKQFFGSAKPTEEEAGEKVMKVKDKNDFLRILAQEIDTAKNEVIAMTKLDENQSILREALHNALQRKVNVRLVSKVPKSLADEARKYLSKGASLKDCDHGMNAYIIDGKKLVLALSDFSKEKPEYHFTIWNNNKPMVNAIQKYFDHCWQQGKEV